MKEEITKYDLEYLGVLCRGVKWGHPEPNIFYFTKDGKEYEFKQNDYIYSRADTDHISWVIEEQFLPWWKDEQIKDLKHRAEVAERALKTVCINVIKDEEDDLAVEPRANILYKAYLKQAEKELAEEEGKE